MYLAVLSACNSHVGVFEAAQNGVPQDGAAGLSLAFLKAGVPRTVVTLWEINDFVTERLMAHFYKQLLDCEAGVVRQFTIPPIGNVADAMRQAVLSLWKERPACRQVPQHWGAFLVNGLP